MCVCTSVSFNRLTYLGSPEEHGAAPLVQPHACGIGVGNVSSLRDLVGSTHNGAKSGEKGRKQILFRYCVQHSTLYYGCSRLRLGET